jgi:hypothetical protein
MNEERICRIHEAERQSEVDYFINKNARAFLREQFDLWLFQYVFTGESEWTEQRIKQLQVLKDIALKVIDFISQFEDELVKIWNKPKFVLNSSYVITLDRIARQIGDGAPKATHGVSNAKDRTLKDRPETERPLNTFDTDYCLYPHPGRCSVSGFDKILSDARILIR